MGTNDEEAGVFTSDYKITRQAGCVRAEDLVEDNGIAFSEKIKAAAALLDGLPSVLSDLHIGANDVEKKGGES